MGNIIHSVSEHVSYIATENTWIESKAIQQLQTTAALPNMVSVVGMPDLHPGRGYPIGAAFFSAQRFYPALVGNDIGCGMRLFQTDIKSTKLNLDKFEKQLSTMPDSAPLEWLDEHVPHEMKSHHFMSSLGSIGGGNHFAEFQIIDKIFSDESITQSGLNKKCALLLVHSGSRGLGQSILRQHVENYGHNGLEESSNEAKAYLEAHQNALSFAELNRQLIGLRMLQQVKAKGEMVLDVNHNLVEPCTLSGIEGWLHRKGATPSDQGMVIIPGSRGDFSYLVLPHPREVSLNSLAHGAGRKWMRTECKGRLSHRYTPLQLARTALGSRVICANKQLIYEEAPQSYKSIETVIESMVGAGLIEVIARLRPLLTYKTSGECA
ncbi:RNA ligase RtcB family protein [Providencia vermicola]|uniref:RNA ligase RtcB family protein n=1 Tax=Providencia TaxID=586 RepID=UPI0012B5A99B|nr:MULTISPECIES: RNA ligase RtcB family protein [Providencia]ELZ5939803.1 RNA ligase RtcB family protein [Providencia stuartii]MCK1144976.1 RNA ligase RtcB family protein [Providencia stuartii]MTB40999.1 RNA ligase RtcB family protein [Providencia sp. wls1949]MTC09296.1 RNA ligase RtcB family protein [Providencia sp. wls1948]WBA57336.1 RNA ligase RtcB family protein [Providencia sp. 21OH12SH02B-Prov]